MARHLFIDCDPGIDDAISLFTVFAEKDVRVLGISTVAGNLPVTTTADNACRLLTLLQVDDVPVAKGADRPLLRPLVIAPEVHGENGLGGVQLPPPRIGLDPRHGVILMIEEIRRSPEPVTLLATGPLTNVALAIRLEPELRQLIERIVLMGGSTGRGNVSPAAEFNIFVDPEAARIVFESGIPLVMVGLNVTEQVLVFRSDLARLRRQGGRVAQVAADLLDFYIRFHETTRHTDASPLHDAVAAVEALHPGTLETVAAGVVIETKGEATSGATVVDFQPGNTPRHPTRVAVAVEPEAVKEQILTALEQFAAP